MSETLKLKYKSNPWKDKYRSIKKANKHLTRANTRLRIRCATKAATIQSQKKLLQIQANAFSKMDGKITLGVRPRRHKYSVALIWICVYFQTKVGLSYRQVQEVIRRFIWIAQLQTSTPSATAAADRQHSQLGQKNRLPPPG